MKCHFLNNFKITFITECIVRVITAKYIWLFEIEKIREKKKREEKEQKAEDSNKRREE